MSMFLGGLEIDEYLEKAAQEFPSVRRLWEALQEVPLGVRRLCRGALVAPFRPVTRERIGCHFSCRDFHHCLHDRLHVLETWPYLHRELVPLEDAEESVDREGALDELRSLNELASQVDCDRVEVRYAVLCLRSAERLLEYRLHGGEDLLTAEAEAVEEGRTLIATGDFEDENVLLNDFVLDEKLKNLRPMPVEPHVVSSDFLQWALPQLEEEKPFDFQHASGGEMYGRAETDRPWPSPHEFSLDASWCLVSEVESPVVSAAIRSFRTKIRQAFGVEFNGCSGPEIRLRTGALARKDYSLQATEGGAVICGGSDLGVMYGLYYLEYLLLMRGALCLPKGLDLMRHSKFDTRMVMSYIGWMQWPDEYLELLPRYGVDAIYMSPYANVCGGPRYKNYGHLQSPERVREVIRRAKKWGLKVYCQFVNMLEGQSETDEDGVKPELKLVDRLLGMFPELDGMILLTEGFAADPEIINEIAARAKSIKPEVDVIVWKYNGLVDDDSVDDIRDFTERCSLDTVQMVTWDKSCKLERDGQFQYVYDYSVAVPGPGSWPKAQIAVEHAKGSKRLFARIDGWNTWMFGVLPYLPYPRLWLDKQELMVQYGVNCSLDTWTYGFNANIMAELKNLECWDGGPSRAEAMERIAAREFGRGNVDRVLRAWECFSEGAALSPVTGHGLSIAAVGVPLFFERPQARLWQTRAEQERCHGKYGVSFYRYWPYLPQFANFRPDFSNRKNMAEVYASCHIDYFGYDDICSKATSGGIREGFSLKTYLKYMRLAAEKFSEGLECYREAARHSPAACRHRALRHVLLAEMMLAIHRSSVAILEFEDCRLHVEERPELMATMRAIAEDELERTRDAKAMMLKDSRMGFENEYDYYFTQDTLQEKIDILKDILNRQMPAFMAAHGGCGGNGEPTEGRKGECPDSPWKGPASGNAQAEENRETERRRADEGRGGVS